MNDFKNLASQIDELQNQAELVKNIEMINKYYSNYISHKLVDRKLDEISEDMYEFEKFRRKLLRMYKMNDDLSKLYSAIGATNSISMMSKNIYSIICVDEDFKRKTNNLLKRKYVKNIIEYVYDKPDIRHTQLCEKLNIKANFLTELMKNLIDGDIIVKYKDGKYSYYELTSRMAEYYRSELRVEYYRYAKLSDTWKIDYNVKQMQEQPQNVWIIEKRRKDDEKFSDYSERFGKEGKKLAERKAYRFA